MNARDLTSHQPHDPGKNDENTAPWDAIVIGAGQAGLATAYHLQRAGLRYLVLNASDAPTGSWPRYYESLKLFSPAAYSNLPGLAFPGDPSRYPLRNEVVDYLQTYATHFNLTIQHRTPVTRVTQHDGQFVAHSATGEVFRAHTVVAASGAFNVPYMPEVPGQETFRGLRQHAIDYTTPAALAGKRVVVVGAANTAVQLAVELDAVADTTLAVRSRVRFAPQRLLGKDIHFWLDVTGLDRSRWLKDKSAAVLDDGTYARALKGNHPRQKPMFTAFTRDGVRWADGTEEPVDAVVFATGYRPNLGYLTALLASVRDDAPGTRDPDGKPLAEDADAHHQDRNNGISMAVHGLYYVGFASQRRFSSATLRGVGPDAAHVVADLTTHLAGVRT